MSDFGMFEADEATQAQPRLAARTAARKLEAALDEVRAKFGRFLLGATGIDEFGDRWHYSKADIRKAVEPYVFPNTGTMRRIQNAMKQDWKLAHPYKLALDHDEAGYGQMETDNTRHNQDLDETYHPSSGNLIPEGDFEGWKDSVDQDGPEKVSDHVFTPGGDSGRSAKRRRQAGEHDLFGPDGHVSNPNAVNPYTGDSTSKGLLEVFPVGEESGPKHAAGLNREAAALVADIYTDFARSNGLRVASLDTLDAYASTGIHEADYRLLQSMIVRAAEDCDDEDDEGDDSEDEDEDSEESEGGKAPDFGGSDGDTEADTDGDGDHDDEDHHDGEGGEEEYDFGDENSDGEHDDADHHDGGEEYDFGGDGGGDVGQTFTVPDEAPELDPRLMQEIPAGDTDGSAPIPPEVVDSLLGLPEGTIEQLLLEEVSQGGGDPGMSGPPVPGGAPRGGGDDFLDEVGDDADAGGDPKRMAARRRFARLRQAKECNCWDGYCRVPGTKPCSEGSCEKCDSHRKESRRRLQARARNGDARAYASLRAEWDRGRRARRFWAAEGDEQPGGGDASGGAQPPQGDPSQGGDPAAMGMDPAAMGGGQPMMPPPGSGAVAPPQPPQPLENQPAEDALLDTANQAIMQMIDRETQEYQQIIDPLSQALQAIQFAQQVEQSEHPMDVTPPEGTVDVSPSAAPGGAQAMQQQARRRKVAKSTVLRNAARLIAGRYHLSHGGERMLLEAMGRRNYEHVREALQLLPPQHLPPREYRAAVRHIGEMFAADNPRFNRDVWMRSVLGSALGSRHPFDRPRLAGETLVHTPTMDHFEWENDQPRVDDNNPTTDLPKMKGAARDGDAVSRFQRWTKWREQNGLVVPGGEGGVHAWMQKTRNPAKPKVGPRASGEVHRSVGAEPDQPKLAPKTKPVKAVNPTLKKPKAAPKAPARRTAAGFFLDGPRDEGDGRPDPSTLHCSRCGHTAPGAADRDDNLCPRCPGSVMDYQFYGHPTSRLVEDFHDDPDSNYGDALFEELKYRSDMDDDVDAAGAVSKGPRESPLAWESDRSRHPSAAPRGDEHRPGRPIPRDEYRLPPDADPRVNRNLLSNRREGRQASFFTRKVPGWRWDDHLNGYLSKEARAFTCACGERIAAPSYRTCACGKVWNVYAIGDSHHLASDTADMYVAREIEVRPGVIMANRKMAGVEDFGDWASQFSGDFFNRGRSNHDDYDIHPSDCGHNDQDLLDDGQSILCNDCGSVVGPMADQGRTGYEGWDPDADPGSDDPRIRGAALFARLAASGMSYEDAMAHIDEVLAEGEGHDLHRYPGAEDPHKSPLMFSEELRSPDDCPNCGGDGVDWDTYPNHEGDADLCQTCDGTGDAAVEFEPHLREPRPGSIRAEAAWRRHLAEIGRLADWTKYDDDVDPVVEAYGKTKPPSTRIPKQPRDWAKRTPAGTWQGPAIPRKRK